MCCHGKLSGTILSMLASEVTATKTYAMSMSGCQLAQRRTAKLTGPHVTDAS